MKELPEIVVGDPRVRSAQDAVTSLMADGCRVNDGARKILGDLSYDEPPETWIPVVVTISDLGLSGDPYLGEYFEAAKQQNLLPIPLLAVVGIAIPFLKQTRIVQDVNWLIGHEPKGELGRAYQEYLNFRHGYGYTGLCWAALAWHGRPTGLDRLIFGRRVG